MKSVSLRDTQIPMFTVLLFIIAKHVTKQSIQACCARYDGAHCKPCALSQEDGKFEVILSYKESFRTV